MPPIETRLMTSTLDKLAKELCRQSTQRHKRELANDAKIAKILNDGLKLDPGLRSREKLLSAADFIVPSVDHGGEGARRESAFEVL
jgi:hypothetical protein